MAENTGEGGAPAVIQDGPARLLRRTTQDRVIAGICGGLARYFRIDPVLVRVSAVVFGVMGAGIPAYLIAWLVIPSDEGRPVSSGPGTDNRTGAYVAGTVLIALGIAWALRLAVPGLDKVLWPVVLVGVGVMLLAGTRR
jgi:phage shock protein C